MGATWRASGVVKAVIARIEFSSNFMISMSISILLGKNIFLQRFLECIVFSTELIPITELPTTLSWPLRKKHKSSLNKQIFSSNFCLVWIGPDSNSVPLDDEENEKIISCEEIQFKNILFSLSVVYSHYSLPFWVLEYQFLLNMITLETIFGSWRK